MKAALGKTIGGISSFTRGTYNVLTFSRFRRSQTVVQNDATGGMEDRELNSLYGTTTHGSPERSLSGSYTPPPHNRPSITQEDDVLYRKNNVYLKCEIGAAMATNEHITTPTDLDGSVSPAVQSLHNLQGTTPPSPEYSPQHKDKVPGFLFIASRGSNYGSTLILNWAPNSSIIKCSGSINSTICTAGEASDNEMMTSGGSEREQNGHHTTPTDTISESNSSYSILCPPSPSTYLHTPPSITTSVSATTIPHRTEHKCVSIDLGDMEMIRIFYQVNESGCKVSGEMVVSSKQTNFWVFQFPNGGLTDLLHLFRSWKYFNHHEHK